MGSKNLTTQIIFKNIPQINRFDELIHWKG